MNRSLIVAALTVTMFIMMSSVGHAFSPPHMFACENCHGKYKDLVKADASTWASAANNGCTGCHNTLSEAPRMPMDPGSMANFHGTVANQPATGSRSNHTSKAPSISDPNKANTREPTGPLSLTSDHYSVAWYQQVLCNRCHFSAGTNSTQNVDKPFLRSTNVGDALCLDCHFNRIAANTATGTHPVASKAYSTVYKANTTAFRRTPLSPNQNNPTAKLGNYLYQNKIVCTTCHAVHYGDSNSATLDNRSTANGSASDDVAKGLKGQLQNSKGQLLRTDPVGATASSINVCSSCHKETKNLNHNGKGQNVQCDHCHGAHVDYAGVSPPAGEVAPNIYLVRRDFSNISTNGIKLGANVKVIYNTATSLRFKRDDGRGICTVCHIPPPTVSAHTAANTRKADCIGCHKHSDGFSAANCTSCHGQPPVTSVVGGPNGKATTSYTVDESFTPHVTHADKGYYDFACNNCHYNGTPAAYHNKGSYADVFVDPANSIGASAGFTNVPADYNSTNKTCANVYCHSNGNPRGGAISWKSATTPGWAFGKNKILGQANECSTCHDSGADLKTNAHYGHVTDNSFKCYVCHSATVNSAGAITDRSMHANGAKDVVFATRPPQYLSVFSGSFDKVAGTCTNTCHSNGVGGAPLKTALWTEAAGNKGAAYCGSCHAAAPDTSLHPMHFTATQGPLLGTSGSLCVKCHSGTSGSVTHANGVVDLKAGNPCAPCHPSTKPLWATGQKVTCESCHTGATASKVDNAFGTYTAPLKNLNRTLGHGKYSTASLNVKCTACHDNTKAHIGAAQSEKRLIVAGNTGTCDLCHTTAAGKGLPSDRLDLKVHGGSVTRFDHYTSTANRAIQTAVRSDACAGCHDTHGTTNLYSIRTKINGVAVSFDNKSTTRGSGTGYVTPAGDGLCQVCHTKTSHYRSGQNNGPVAHYTANCLSCHDHKAAWAFAPTGGGCAGCHGFPPARNLTGLNRLNNYTSASFQDYSGGGGAHTVAGHLPKTVKESDGLAACTNCHNINWSNDHAKGGTPPKRAYVNVIVDTKFKFNNISAIKYNSTNMTCSNVSCHYQKSPSWPIKY